MSRCSMIVQCSLTTKGIRHDTNRSWCGFAWLGWEVQNPREINLKHLVNQNLTYISSLENQTSQPTSNSFKAGKALSTSPGNAIRQCLENCRWNQINFSNISLYLMIKTCLSMSAHDFLQNYLVLFWKKLQCHSALGLIFLTTKLFVLRKLYYVRC